MTGEPLPLPDGVRATSVHRGTRYRSRLWPDRPCCDDPGIPIVVHLDPADLTHGQVKAWARALTAALAEANTPVHGEVLAGGTDGLAVGSDADMADRQTYTVEVHDEGDGMLWGAVVELPGCFASGDTIGELLEAAAEAIQMYLAAPSSVDGPTVSFDPTLNAAYVSLRPTARVARGFRVSAHVNIDLDDAGGVLGIELLDVSQVSVADPVSGIHI